MIFLIIVFVLLLKKMNSSQSTSEAQLNGKISQFLLIIFTYHSLHWSEIEGRVEKTPT